MIVDDVKMNILVFTGLLKGCEMEIDKAASGPEALEKTKQKKASGAEIKKPESRQNWRKGFMLILKAENLQGRLIVLTTKSKSCRAGSF